MTGRSELIYGREEGANSLEYSSAADSARCSLSTNVIAIGLLKKHAQFFLKMGPRHKRHQTQVEGSDKVVNIDLSFGAIFQVPHFLQVFILLFIYKSALIYML